MADGERKHYTLDQLDGLTREELLVMVRDLAFRTQVGAFALEGLAHGLGLSARWHDVVHFLTHGTEHPEWIGKTAEQIIPDVEEEKAEQMLATLRAVKLSSDTEKKYGN